jgi:hypothetical protein
MGKQVVENKNKVSIELQTILDHLSGPAPHQRLNSFLNSDIDEQYIRGTWYNSSYYLQNNKGEWFLAYPYTGMKISISRNQ